MEHNVKLHELLDSALADFVRASNPKLLDSSTIITLDEFTNQFLRQSIKNDDDKVIALLTGMQSSLDTFKVNFQDIFEGFHGSQNNDLLAKEMSRFETDVKDFQEEGGSDENIFLPYMEKLLENVLCNDILTPSVNELLEKYPNYIEKNGNNLDPVETIRYQKQLELFTTLSQYLKTRANDEPGANDLKIKGVLSTMQQLHEYGKPPQAFIEHL